MNLYMKLHYALLLEIYLFYQKKVKKMCKMYIIQNTRNT